MLLEKKIVDFEDFVGAHIEFVYNLSCHFTACKEDAEDLVQDVFTEILPSFSKLEDVIYPRAWLAKIVFRRYVNRWKRAKRSPVIYAHKVSVSNANNGIADPIEAASSYEPGPRELVQEDQQREYLIHAVNRLNEKYRRVIILHDIEGFTLAEIRQIVDIPLGTLKARLHRARAKLQKILTKKGKNFWRIYDEN